MQPACLQSCFWPLQLYYSILCPYAALEQASRMPLCAMQVVDLSSAVDRLSCEKVDLERQFEMEVWAAQLCMLTIRDSWDIQ